MDAHAEFIDEVVAEHGDQARWTVLGFHHSIYSTATHWNDLDVKRLRKAIPPVAARNDIDLVVSGHDHIYNRTFLMDGEGKPVEGSEAGAEEEKEGGQTLYLTLTSSSGSKFYDYVPGLDWEGKSVHNDVPAFTRVQVSDEALRATTYEVPVGSAPADGGQAQAAAEQIDDVELRRAEAEEPDPGDDAGADADAEGGAEGEDAGAEGADAEAGAGADAAGAEDGKETADSDGGTGATGSDAVADAAGADVGQDADGTGDDADAGTAGAEADSAESGTETADSEGGAGSTGSESDSGTEANAAGTADDSDSSGTASAGGDGDLPRTGGGLALPLAVGAGALALGALLLFASRRRRAGLS